MIKGLFMVERHTHENSYSYLRNVNISASFEEVRRYGFL